MSKTIACAVSFLAGCLVAPLVSFAQGVEPGDIIRSHLHSLTKAILTLSLEQNYDRLSIAAIEQKLAMKTSYDAEKIRASQLAISEELAKAKAQDKYYPAP